MEEKVAKAYDSAALKYWGPMTHINFPVLLENYHQEFEDMKNMTRQEYVAHLRRLDSPEHLFLNCISCIGHRFINKCKCLWSLKERGLLGGAEQVLLNRLNIPFL